VQRKPVPGVKAKLVLKAGEGGTISVLPLLRSGRQSI